VLPNPLTARLRTATPRTCKRSHVNAKRESFLHENLTDVPAAEVRKTLGKQKLVPTIDTFSR
jgi:hypothetical protein